MAFDFGEKRLGFGCMRLPMVGGAEGTVDQEQFNKMIDLYMDAGFSYFDTAHVYIGGESEKALCEGLVKRYPRDSFFLTDKLSGSQFRTAEDIRPFFEKQLAATEAGYFDCYLMHSQSASVYEHFMECRAYEQVNELMREGKIRHMGISFHDKAEVLEKILTEQPQIEVVQIQLNYFDWDSPSIESGRVYEVCRKFHKPVLVMEPVKGGGLVQLPKEAEQVFAQLHGGSPASYAIRFAASCEGVVMVLSGMSDVAQMEDNLSYMSDFKPLSDAERKAIEQVRTILKNENAIACTGCRYCVAGCPKKILIPDIFACLNTQKRYQDWSSDYYYGISTQNHGKASDCIRCRRCEKICPQHLPVTEYLKEAAQVFEKA